LKESVQSCFVDDCCATTNAIVVVLVLGLDLITNLLELKLSDASTFEFVVVVKIMFPSPQLAAWK